MKKISLIIILLLTLFIFSVVTSVSVLAKKSEGQEPLQKITFVHYKKGYARPNSGNRKARTICYSFLANGAKWKSLPVNYIIDPDNPDGLSSNFINNAIHKSAEEWDKYTSRELFGNYLVDYNASWDSSRPDGRNEFVFGNYPEFGVIAVTNIWGYFYGKASQRKIVEFDVMFDTDYEWGDAILNPAVMDLQNIATHEIGHGVGLADLYSTSCSLETMYGYSNYGETQKRDLGTGDILGLRKLYGI